jgi:hypothetical protein
MLLATSFNAQYTLVPCIKWHPMKWWAISGRPYLHHGGGERRIAVDLLLDERPPALRDVELVEDVVPRVQHPVHTVGSLVTSTPPILSLLLLVCASVVTSKLKVSHAPKHKSCPDLGSSACSQ